MSARWPSRLAGISVGNDVGLSAASGGTWMSWAACGAPTSASRALRVSAICSFRASICWRASGRPPSLWCSSNRVSRPAFTRSCTSTRVSWRCASVRSATPSCSCRRTSCVLLRTTLADSSTRAAWASASAAWAVPRAASSAERYLPKKSSSQLALSCSVPLSRMVPASGAGMAPLRVYSWRVASNAPFTCGSRAASATSVTASARASRVWAILRLGLSCSACLTRRSSCGSPQACHQSLATGLGNFTAVEAVGRPRLSGWRSWAWGSMPDMSAQPAMASSMAMPAMPMARRPGGENKGVGCFRCIRASGFRRCRVGQSGRCRKCAAESPGVRGIRLLKSRAARGSAHVTGFRESAHRPVRLQG